MKKSSLAIAAVALILTACSGDPAADYFSDVRDVNQKYIAEAAELTAVGPSSSPDDLRAFFPKRTAALDNALDGLVEITPPTEFAVAHNKFIDGLAQFADLSEAIALETQNLETSEDVISLAAHPVFGIGSSNDIEEAAVEACRVLQTIANENEVSVDLACDDLS